MKRLMALMASAFFVLALSACGGGGGGGDDSSSEQSYPITDNTVLNYVGGEILTYNFTYSSKFEDGSATAAEGTETSYFYSGYSFENLPYAAYKRVTVVDANATSTSTNDYYFYDENNNFVHYLTSNDNYYTNQTSNLLGAVVLPNKLVEGYSWTNDPLLVVFDGESFSGSRTFTVISKEFISVPFGKIETYKITYSGSFTAQNDGLSVIGTVWVNPDIGVVKNIDTTVQEHFAFPETHSYTSELKDINWTLE